jgi:hypothetical protein
MSSSRLMSILFLHVNFAQKFLFSCCDYLSVVIMLSMGSAKKKPMTKKEREEKRRKHKEKRLKK